MCCCDFKISCCCILECLKIIGCNAVYITFIISGYKLIKLLFELVYKIYENIVRERIEKEKLDRQEKIMKAANCDRPHVEDSITNIQAEYIKSLKFMIQQTAFEDNTYKNELLKYINEKLK